MVPWSMNTFSVPAGGPLQGPQSSWKTLFQSPQEVFSPQASVSHKSIVQECPARVCAMCWRLDVCHQEEQRPLPRSRGDLLQSVVSGYYRSLRRETHRQDRRCPDWQLGTVVQMQYWKQLLGAVASNWQLRSANVVRNVAKLHLSTRVSHESVPLCPARVSHESAQNSFPQECLTRVSHKIFPQECSARASPTRVSNNVWPFVFECVCALGFVGSIMFFKQVGVVFFALRTMCQ